MLISLHLPKTAGSSFLTALKEIYGSSLLSDFADLPINTPAFKRNKDALLKCILNGIQPPNEFECIHGHFLPLKYLLCRDAKFVTWMRDPVERLASHYFYWLRNYNPQNAPPLHKKVIEENWSLEHFCLCPELKNLYHQFLWGFPVKRFDFVGITEFYESETEYFSRQFLGGVELNVHRNNINSAMKATTYIEDKRLRDKVIQHHSKDISLYERALAMRLNRTP
jgi:hypothetical protein